jgi:hypothetical protein
VRYAALRVGYYLANLNVARREPLHTLSRRALRVAAHAHATELLDALADGAREALDLCAGRAARAQAFAQLRVGDAAQVAVEPARVRRGDAFSRLVRALTDVAPAERAVVLARDEIGSLRRSLRSPTSSA